jgi:predicted amidophosphoribosyltransferase
MPDWDQLTVIFWVFVALYFVRMLYDEYMQRECPYCKKKVPKAASVCSYCSREIPVIETWRF